MTTREIGEIVEQLYGHYYSPQTISVITKQLDEKVNIPRVLLIQFQITGVF